MKEQIVTGQKFRILADVTERLWHVISLWTKAQDVEFNDGTNAQAKLGNIAGISDSLTSTASNVAASAKAVKNLNDKVDTAQDGINTIYNAIVGQGVTPANKIPETLSHAIGIVASNKYDYGYNEGYNEGLNNASFTNFEFRGAVYTRGETDISDIKTENYTLTFNAGCKYILSLLNESVGGYCAPKGGCATIFDQGHDYSWGFSNLRLMKVDPGVTSVIFEINSHTNSSHGAMVSFLLIY